MSEESKKEDSIWEWESERERGWEVGLEKKRREYFESGGEESV